MAPSSNRAARVMGQLRTMLVIREFDEAAGREWTKGNVRGSVHQYVGQEAIAVGVCSNLRRDDYISSNHRGHGHTLAKGADPFAMMAELFGRTTGTCGGKGGSMHIADFSIGMLGANGVVADGATTAVGAAQSIKILKQDRVAVAFFGDGAVNRGPIMEAFNWAKIYNLPMLFVCENNGYAATTKSSNFTAGEGFVGRMKACAIEGETVDGNDLLAVDALAERTIARIRGGGGPGYIHALTYRHHTHNMKDNGSYRTQDEVDRWKQKDRDPITRCEAWLAGEGVPASDFAKVRSEAAALIAAAVEAAVNAPWPEPGEALKEVQDLGAPL
jgi:TPP-dependent pyruvate/acetoin dehydrogenase alpha subunit